MVRWLVRVAALATAASGAACGGSGASSSAGASSSVTSAPRSSAAVTASATTTASHQSPATTASASARQAPPPTAADFGPDVSRTAVEAVNASAAYDHNQPQFALDGKSDTAWAAPGEAKPWIELSLLPGTRVDGIELAGQRDATKTKDYWAADSVIKRARVVWDGGEGEITFARASDKGVRKKLPIGAVTRRVRLEILEIERGEKSSDIDIAEIGIFGVAPATSPADPKGLSGLCRAGQLRVRFREGTVYGGEWVDAPGGIEPVDGPPLWRWMLLPIPVRVDDGEWHTLGVRYAEESEMLDDGTKAVTARSVGKLLRFRAGPDGFEADQDGKKASGKCGPS
ncbi:MAG: discoidin domain-containing protein [Myxococcales bacterium]|nr:discoidin domain-containing protein [Myxococcales bacterium]